MFCHILFIETIKKLETETKSEHIILWFIDSELLFLNENYWVYSVLNLIYFLRFEKL